MALDGIVTDIEAARAAGDHTRALLVGISGIDASGKGFVSARLEAELHDRGWNVANLNVDGWLNLPDVRFGGSDPGRHFYENALRLDEMFDWLVLPLRNRRSIRLEADHTDETATDYRKVHYAFDAVDIVLLEGIFLFKRRYRDHFDLRVWVQCAFETALQRAIARSQEGLPPEAAVRAYETIYFPAQRLHQRIDDPVAAAHLVFLNGAAAPSPGEPQDRQLNPRFAGRSG